MERMSESFSAAGEEVKHAFVLQILQLFLVNTIFEVDDSFVQSSLIEFRRADHDQLLLQSLPVTSPAPRIKHCFRAAQRRVSGDVKELGQSGDFRFVLIASQKPCVVDAPGKQLLENALAFVSLL